MPLLDHKLLKKTGIIGLVTGELVVFVGGGYWLGSWLDSRMQSNPAFTAVLCLLGAAYSGWKIWRLAIGLMK